MRTIKFRAWDTEHKKFFDLSGEYLNPLTGKIVHDEDNSCCDPECCGGPNPYYVDQDHYVLQQYTGLKDKNGVEIYEGDIVKTVTNTDYENEEEIRVVSFNQFEWKLARNGVIPEGSLGFNWGGWDTFEVIGNIYANPELL